jgi:hypothetical protein
MAEPPKLMRRVKGVVGAVLALDATSSSSMALSSIESEFELVDMLLRRRPNDGGWFGAEPESPSVVTDSRRICWSFWAADWFEPWDMEAPRWKRFEKAAWLIEARRAPLATSPPPPPLAPLSDDIVVEEIKIWLWWLFAGEELLLNRATGERRVFTNLIEREWCRIVLEWFASEKRRRREGEIVKRVEYQSRCLGSNLWSAAE